MTNFDSAHDSDGSMTIDSHFDEEGDLINHMNDSVWYVFTFSFQLSEARDHPIPTWSSDDTIWRTPTVDCVIKQ